VKPRNVDRQTSSRMASIKTKRTSLELSVNDIVACYPGQIQNNYEWLPGRPDVVLPELQKVIFVHGCFWHDHQGCKLAQRPMRNAHFWRAKRNLNRQRDKRNIQQLKIKGWDVLIVWGCELKVRSSVEKRIKQFLEAPSPPHGTTLHPAD
jgi:DNA mismatch endonuclease, patch repair protein